MIKPIVAGQFYPKDFGELTKQIEESFKLGPGDLPTRRKDKKLFGILVPHAGYAYSGQCAAWAYKELAEAKFEKTYVIIAPDHNGRHNTVTTCKENWETPLGIIPVDKDFILHLKEKCPFIKEDEIKEHAVEVQLPFLQYACRDRIKDLKIVPLVIPNENNFEELGRALSEISEDICIIISSDFTHYGPNYGYVPFTLNIKSRLKMLDHKAIQLIEQLKTKEFLNYVKATKATICGSSAIAVGIEALKEMFSKKGKLLSYYTSGDFTKNYTNSVSYASLEFR
ncbi:MAG: AmmeMemoRadiSam system protein B [Nanoarchaeota archaeon]|nr:AmmeMemoRadiSam system protein B [Nanoarchaeota archaeon]MBU4241789.1 AmmeMemoRadiSam system protein B [Nanoarchaeota archaeon]MBU4352057.1 AmmeMemoRadiSam system protein B [Nanoarchaeota archaeon]